MFPVYYSSLSRLLSSLGFFLFMLSVTVQLGGKHAFVRAYRCGLGQSVRHRSGFFSRLILRGGFSAGFETDPGSVKGTDLKILKYPHPQLRAENDNISDFDDTLKQTAAEMLLVMYAADGIGLAAPQVGINKRLMVFNEKGDAKETDHEMVLVNPEIVETSNSKSLGEEGCLSFPQIYGEVQRHDWISVKYQNLEGEHVDIKFEGKPSIIFQHEYDHLDQVLFIDRLEEKDKKINQKRLDKYVKKYGPGAAP